jgi:uncharacterized protein with LGFP repeats/pimeloyl-ACP methyl ester carboxylesterase
VDNTNDGDAAADSSSSPNQQSETETTSPAEQEQNIREKLETTSPSEFEAPKSDQPAVGIIDTGFAGNNPDIDYDNVTLGQDRVDGDDNPLLEEGEGNQHGTHTLGLISAQQNNGEGINGINDEAPVWLGRGVGGNNWEESLNEFVDQVQESGRENAVVNLSMDLTQTDEDGNVTTRYELTPEERKALEYARQNNVAVVVAAGNDGGVMSALGQASQEFDNLITVGAAEETDASVSDARGHERADYSSYGRTLDIVAEGGTEDDGVLSTVGDGVGTMNGSSVATAKVTGAVSQVWAANPDLSYRQVLDLLKDTATDLNNPNWDEQTGAGLLNIAAAVNLARVTTPEEYDPEPLFAPDSWSGEGEFTAGERAVNRRLSLPDQPSFEDSAQLDSDISEVHYGVKIDKPGYLRWKIQRKSNDFPEVEFVDLAGDPGNFKFRPNKGAEVGITVSTPGEKPSSKTGGEFVEPGKYHLKVKSTGTEDIQSYDISTELIPDNPSSSLGDKPAHFIQPDSEDNLFDGTTSETLNANTDIGIEVFEDGSGWRKKHTSYGLEVQKAGKLKIKPSFKGDKIDLIANKFIGSGDEKKEINRWEIDADEASENADPIELNVNKGRYEIQVAPSLLAEYEDKDVNLKAQWSPFDTVGITDGAAEPIPKWETAIDEAYNNSPVDLGDSETSYQDKTFDSQGTSGKYRGYENGSIYWTEEHGAIPIWGSIEDAYAQQDNGSMGWLGFPTKQEYSWKGGKRTDFEGGYIYWNGEKAQAYHHGEMPLETVPQPGEGKVPYDAGDYIETKQSNSGVVTHYYENGHLIVQPNGGEYWYESGNGGEGNDSTSPSEFKDFDPLPLSDVGFDGTSVHQTYLNTFQRNGGPENLGFPINYVHPWEDGYTQDFDGGSAGRGAIMKSNANDNSYWVGGQIWEKFLDLGGAEYVGYPKTDAIPVEGGSDDSGGFVQSFRGAEGIPGKIWLSDHGAHPTWGAIGGKYEELNGPESFLGFPTSGENGIGNGWIEQYFEGGRILWHPESGAMPYSNETIQIWDKFQDLGGAEDLGYPETEVTPVEGGLDDSGGFVQSFPGGEGLPTKIWLSDHGAHPTWGAIGDKYEELDGPESFLGFPTSGEQGIGDGWVKQHFEGGYILWHPQHGAIAYETNIPNKVSDTGNGSTSNWHAQYWNNRHLAGSPEWSHYEEMSDLQFHPSNGAPHGTRGIQEDNFGARWITTSYFDGGTYNFINQADDGVRVYVDGELVIDKWKDSPFEEKRAYATVEPGYHQVMVEYFEHHGSAANWLRWEQADAPEEWAGEFFRGKDLREQNLAGHRGGGTESLDTDWGEGHEWGVPISSDNFSDRWSTTRYFDEPGVYEFDTQADDGIRVWVDDRLVIDKWQDQPFATNKALVSLDKGHHRVRVEHYENKGSSALEVDWKKVAGQPNSRYRLYEGDNDSANHSDWFEPWTAEYFNNRNLEGAPVVNRLEDNATSGWKGGFDLDWRDGSPDPKVSSDNFSSRLTSHRYFPAGTYKFKLQGDDGLRFFINGENILDRWDETTFAPREVEVTLSEGIHNLVVEHSEEEGLAYANLDWERLSDSSSHAIAPELQEAHDELENTFGKGAVGVPISELKQEPDTPRRRLFDGMLPASYQEFRGTQGRGALFPTNNGEAHYVFGKLWQAYQDAGGVGVLGPPLASQKHLGHGAYELKLPNGRLFWAPGMTNPTYYEYAKEGSKTLTIPADAWRGEYFDNKNWSGDPVVVRQDSASGGSLDKLWKDVSPAPGVPKDDFSVRWTSNRPFDRGTYRFKGNHDDGFTVEVNDRKPIDEMREVKTQTTGYGTFDESGQYPIEVKHREYGGYAEAELDYEKVSNYVLGLDDDNDQHQAIVDAFNRHGGYDKVGFPDNEVHEWSHRGVVQDFEGGENGDGIIMNADGDEKAYYLSGKIWDTYVDVGGPGELGYPTSDPFDDGHGNTAQEFQENRITRLSSGETFVGGYINGYRIPEDFYRVRKDANMGTPTDEVKTHNSGAKYQMFDKPGLGTSSIVSSQDGTYPLYGGIRDRYLEADGLDGDLGKPRSGEYDWNGGKRQNFEGGYIFWNGSSAIAYNYDGSRWDPSPGDEENDRNDSWETPINEDLNSIGPKQDFGYRDLEEDSDNNHNGVDLNYGARGEDLGLRVEAAKSGTVSRVGYDPDGYGNYVYVDHDNGWQTRYAHLNEISVDQGDEVTDDTKIGEVGSTGNSTGSHLHFEMRKDGDPKDPEDYIDFHGSNVEESNSGNNDPGESAEVTPEISLDYHGALSVEPGETIEVSGEISGSNAVPHEMRFKLGDRELKSKGSFTVTSAAAQNKFTYSGELVIPENLSEGSYQLKAVADNENIEKESSSVSLYVNSNSSNSPDLPDITREFELDRRSNVTWTGENLEDANQINIKILNSDGTIVNSDERSIEGGTFTFSGILEPGKYEIKFSDLQDTNFNYIRKDIPLSGEIINKGLSDTEWLDMKKDDAEDRSYDKGAKLYRYDDDEGNLIQEGIKPDEETIVITHGWQSHSRGSNIENLIEATAKAYPDHQILALDWKGPANDDRDWTKDDDGKNRMPRHSANSITPVAKWAQETLEKLGLQADELSLFGHSLGTYVNSEIARLYDSKDGDIHDDDGEIANMVALDPATPASQYDLDGNTKGNRRPENFNLVAENSNSFVVSNAHVKGGIAGDSSKAATADHSFVVGFQNYGENSKDEKNKAHGGVVQVFSDLLNSKIYGFEGYKSDTINDAGNPDRISNPGGFLLSNPHEATIIAQKQGDQWKRERIYAKKGNGATEWIL